MKKGLFVLLLCGAMCLGACSRSPKNPTFASYTTILDDPEVITALSNSTKIVSSKTDRDNSPKCLVPTAPGKATVGNKYVTVDYSNASEGYIMIDYLGSCAKCKLQLTGPNKVVYTYDLTNGLAAFPLTSGDGDYEVAICENIKDNRYSVVYKGTLKLSGISEFGPYLYPNQYVNFNKDCRVITKAANLAAYSDNDIEVVTNIYNYIIKNITYDYDKADTVKSGYITDVDEILESGTGICLDYSAVMTSMLRSQSIPTRLEVGYASDVYHAWISVYIEEIGWLNGIIQFNGHEWSLVDPTFGASTSEKRLKQYIGDGSNYSTKYVY